MLRVKQGLRMCALTFVQTACCWNIFHTDMGGCCDGRANPSLTSRRLGIAWANWQVKLFVQRLCSDWDGLAAPMRKSLPFKDALSLHTACGMFWHYMDLLQSKAPASEFLAAREKLQSQFMLGVLDHELQMAAEGSVPPGDIQNVGPFRRSEEINSSSML